MQIILWEMPLRTSIWAECSATLFRASAEGDVCHHSHGGYQYHTRPVFIYGFGWGIRGAAVATIVAQVISLTWQFKLFSNKDELLHFHRGIFRLKRKIVFDSLAIGMSPFLMNLAACFIVIIINQGLKKYGGDLAIGGFRHREPSGFHCSDDCDGAESGNAAYCRI